MTPAARAALLVLFLGLLPACLPGLVHARTLVLPLRTLGVSDTTAAVAREILVHELDLRGVDVLAGGDRSRPVPEGASACADRKCAREQADAAGAAQVVYGSLSRLGDKILVQVECLRRDDAAPVYRDRLTSFSEEDLDTVMLRIAEGIASGRPNSDRASVGSVTEDETQEPRRRATRRGLGFRGGAIFPVGDSYGGSDGMTNLQLVYKVETGDYLFETTSLLGLTWGDGNVEWTLLDIFVAKSFGDGDLSSFLGGGLGLRALNVERRGPVNEFGYRESGSQSATTMSLDVGAGLILLRTYDMHFVLEMRYHYLFEDFEEIGGDGAHGLMITFGTSR